MRSEEEGVRWTLRTVADPAAIDQAHQWDEIVWGPHLSDPGEREGGREGDAGDGCGVRMTMAMRCVSEGDQDER